MADNGNQTKTQLTDEVRKLREAEERYRTILEDIPVLICCFRPGGEITYANNAYCTFFATTPEKLAGTSNLFRIPESDRESVKASISALTVESPTQTHEHQVHSPGGKVRWHRWTDHALFDAEGKAVGYISLGEDITEHKRDELQIKRFKAILEAAEEISNQGSWEWDIREDTWTFSENWQRIHGLHASRITRKELMMSAYPEDTARIEAAFQDALDGANPYRLEHRIVRQDNGEVRDILALGLVEHDSSGRPVRMYGVAQDVTERKRVEEDLRELQRRDRAWLEHSPICTKVLDRDFNLQYMSAAGVRELGMDDVTKYYGKPYPFSFYPVEFKAQMRANLNLAKETGEVVQQEGCVVDVEGNDHWYHSTIVPICDNNQLQYMMVVSIEITERKRAEEHLRAIADYTYDWESWFASDGQLMWVNPAVEKLTGYSVAECRAMSDYPLPIVHEVDRAEFGARLRRAIAEQTSTSNLEFRISRKDQSVRWMGASWQPIRDDRDKPIGQRTSIRDITDRKRIEMALIESEEKYRRLAENSPAVVYQFLLTPDGKFSLPYINDKVLDILGVKAETVMKDSSTLMGLVHPEDQDKFRNAISKSAERLEAYRETIRAVRNDGKVLYIEATSLPERKEDGSTLWEGFFVDVTERKQAEDALSERNARLQTYFDLPLVGIAVTSVEKGWLEVNSGLCTMLGYSADELVHMTWPEITHPDDIALDLAQFDRVVSGEIDSYSLEKRFVRKNGDIIWANLSVACVRKPDHSVNYFVALLQDITDRKRTEAERERFMSAIEQAAEAIVITDSDGTIEYVNPAFTSVSGYTRAEATGQNLSVLKSGKYDDALNEQIWDTVLGGETWSGRIVSKRKNGTSFIEEATISPVRDASGKTVNFIAVERDITREVELEEHLRQSQKMEAIGSLAGGIAHDFNNILCTILGFTEMAAAKMDKGSPSREMLDEVKKAAERATELVEQILAISRRKEREYGPILIHAIVKEALKMLRGTLPSTIGIVQNIDKDCGPVMADATEIHQIVLNLCTNAYHAMREKGGRLSVEMREVCLIEDEAGPHPDLRPGQYVRLVVADTGSGIEPETMTRIFEPYFTTKAMGEGTGLGLAIVHGIVHSYGGAITVDSTPGEGSTFTVFFPRAAEEARYQVEEDEADVEAGNGERILAIDDEESITRLYSLFLEHAGYQVEPYTSSEKALEVFRADPSAFDLVITDQTMPKMTGADLSRKLLEIRPGIPIILCSGHSDLIDKDAAVAMGIRSYLKKPLNAPHLARVVRRLLDDRQGSVEDDDMED
ncbi:MAG: PAS domain S-box protein [Candidatus Hydrogenedentes bacterium]|nr:PAS domain S-box protein [Candidatus Hydrogenedentota bacterium]